MNDLTVFNHNGQLYTDSRDVAAMVGKQHKNLIRDIDGYSKIMEEKGKLKIELSDFFVKSTYTSSQNKQLPCYIITQSAIDIL
jgi:Rha family phage regulatory protein